MCLSWQTRVPAPQHLKHWYMFYLHILSRGLFSECFQGPHSKASSGQDAKLGTHILTDDSLLYSTLLQMILLYWPLVISMLKKNSFIFADDTSCCDLALTFIHDFYILLMLNPCWELRLVWWRTCSGRCCACMEVLVFCLVDFVISCAFPFFSTFLFPDPIHADLSYVGYWDFRFCTQVHI